MADQQRDDKADARKYWLGLVMWLVGIGITILAGYTSVTLTRGADAQRLINVENQVKDLQKQVDYMRDNSVTSKEFRLYMDTQTQILNSIHSDVREIRNRK